MEDVALQRRADLLPPRRDRALEVARHHAGELVEAARGIVEQRPDRRRHRRPLEAPPDLGGHPLGGGGAHAGELVAELGERRRRGRREEVRHIAALRRGGEQIQQLVVEALQASSGGARPRQVQRVPGRIAQHVGAPDQVEERRDREARADEVLVAETEADQ